MLVFFHNGCKKGHAKRGRKRSTLKKRQERRPEYFFKTTGNKKHMKKAVYLDYNATAPVKPEVLSLMTTVLGETGNASSVHVYGRKARSHIEKARRQVGDLVKSRPDRVVFTSGATEANNTVIKGFAGKQVWISAIEHPSVLETCPHAKVMPVSASGRLDLEDLRENLEKGPLPDLISVMLVNNETGVIQPLEEITKLAHKHGIPVHTDAVQASGRININFDALGVDMLSLSAHKFGGPLGAGALVYRKGMDPFRLLCGGGQEKKARAGTENVAAIAGFGKAAELALSDFDKYQTLGRLRDRLESEVRRASNTAVIYGSNAPRVVNTSCIGLSGIPAETQLMKLDLEGIAVSTGSACSSGSIRPSHVLHAMNVSDKEAASALRISMGWATKEEDIDHFLEIWSNMVRKFNA